MNTEWVRDRNEGGTEQLGPGDQLHHDRALSARQTYSLVGSESTAGRNGGRKTGKMVPSAFCRAAHPQLGACRSGRRRAEYFIQAIDRTPFDNLIIRAELSENKYN